MGIREKFTMKVVTILGFDYKCADWTNIIGLPLAVGAIVQALWLRYRIITAGSL